MVGSRIHLIGGGPGTLGAFRRHMKTVLTPLAARAGRSKKPLVAYVGAASGDDLGFQRMIAGEIGHAGGRASGVMLASPSAKLSAARGLLEDCDVVFVSGGDVEAGMKVLRERGVLPLFRSLARAGRPIVGLSAGSIMLGRAWVRFPEDDAAAGKTQRRRPAAPKLFSCMGLAPVYVDAHAEEDRWQELRVLLRLVAAKRGDSPTGYGLTQQGGICLERDAEGVKVVPFGTPAPRFVGRVDRVVAARPLPVGSSARVR